MKTLLLIRHAKSDWNDPSQSDMDRTLTERGKSNAEMMAKRMKERAIDIDLFVSSPAKRAKKTARIFMKEYKKKDKKLLLLPSLYEASVKDFYDAIENTSDKEDTVALFSHNPGISEFIDSLDCAALYNMPTSAIYALNIHTKHWKDFRTAEKEFLFFDSPKNEE